MPKVAEIVVVGGGVIGLTCAWQLARAGADVTLLDRDRPGSGASGAALGLLMPSGPTHKSPFPRLHRESLWAYARFADELLEATGVDIEYDRPDRLEILRSASRRENAAIEVRVAAAEWPGWQGGPAQVLLDAAEARRLYPSLTIDEHGLLVCHATAQVNPARLLAALAKACHAAHVLVLENRPVTSIDAAEGRVAGVATPAGRIAADAVVVASGAWTSSLSPQLARWAPITPVRGQAMQFDAGDSSLTSIVRSRPYYCLRQRDGTLLAGATSEPGAGFDASPTDAGAAAIRSGIGEIFPAVKQMAVARHWGGLRPKGADSRPFIGAIPGVEGLFVAAGHYKVGIGMAPITAEIIADLILTGSTARDISTCRPDRRCVRGVAG
jgi:glycine oxidase